MFNTPEDAAQSYLQHWEEKHEHAAELNDVKPLAEEKDEEEGLEAAVQCSICSDTMKQASTFVGTRSVAAALRRLCVGKGAGSER